MFYALWTMITIDDFKKVEIKIGEIKNAEAIPGSEKLLKLAVDFGPKPATALAVASSPDGERDIRQVLSGIAKHVTAESLVGLKCPFITNLPIREMMGLKSEAMIMAASTDSGQFTLLKANEDIPAGTGVR